MANANEHDVAPPSPLPEPRRCLQKGNQNLKIYKDGSVRYGMFFSTREPHTLHEALDDNNWRALMQEEYMMP
jgi:hypothetical protein